MKECKTKISSSILTHLFNLEIPLLKVTSCKGKEKNKALIVVHEGVMTDLTKLLLEESKVN